MLKREATKQASNKQASKIVTGKNVKLAKYKQHYSPTNSLFQPSQLQRNLESWNSDLVPILMLITITDQLITLLKLQRFIVNLAKE